MKKAFISVLLAMCLAFTFVLTACSDEPENADPPPADVESRVSEIIG